MEKEENVDPAIIRAKAKYDREERMYKLVGVASVLLIGGCVTALFIIFK